MLQCNNSPLATGRGHGMRGRRPPKRLPYSLRPGGKALKPDASGPAKGPKDPGF